MGKVLTGVTSLVLLLAAATIASAQVEPATPVLPARPISAATSRAAMAPDASDEDVAGRSAEAAKWVDEFTAWKEWAAQWGNRRQPGWFTGYRDRRDAPVPPAWLQERCASVFDETDPLRPACVLLREWNEDFTVVRLRQVTATANNQNEQDTRTTFWQQLHVDVLWPAMQWRSSTYGVIGMHLATTVKGRFQVFIAPGAMLLNLPARNGTRAWKFAANYGIGYRLFEFAFPGNRVAVLHANAARAWVMSDITDVVTERTIDFAGFSLTFKRLP
jgi:hypothetical protein